MRRDDLDHSPVHAPMVAGNHKNCWLNELRIYVPNLSAARRRKTVVEPSVFFGQRGLEERNSEIATWFD